MGDAVDTRYKRASATALVLPCMFTLHSSNGPGVNKRERWGATWMYIGSVAITFVLAPGIRLYIVQEEDRGYEIYKEARRCVVFAESRSAEVASENRTRVIPEELRTKSILR